jgi:site-specific recombinase XerC
MSDEQLPALRPPRPVWNKGRIVGQKRPLAPKHVWSIRVRLEMAGNRRDLALFNSAIDSKLRGCDLVRMKVRDVYAAGTVKERTSIVQSKTGKPVRFEITETTRHSLQRWIAASEMTGAEFLWPSRVHGSPHLSTRQYARIMRGWVISIGLEPSG